eukprot:g2127.t1
MGLQDELAKPVDASDLASPEAAKAEVVRLRQLLAKGLEETGAGAEDSLTGACFCGKIKVKVSGAPLLQSMSGGCAGFENALR